MDLFGTIIAVSDNNSNVKACIQNPHIELKLREDGKINVGRAVGKNGFLNIIKDIGLKEPYVGIVPLTSGEIAEDFARYFAESEQVNNAIALGVLVNYSGVKRAGGYEITLMSDVSDDIVTIIEENLKNAPQISKLLSENKKLKEIAKIISGDKNLKVLEDSVIPKYQCNCSLEKFEKGLISLGKSELHDLYKSGESVEIKCQFCNKKYIFDKEKIRTIIDNL